MICLKTHMYFGKARTRIPVSCFPVDSDFCLGVWRKRCSPGSVRSAGPISPLTSGQGRGEEEDRCKFLEGRNLTYVTPYAVSTVHLEKQP